MAEKKRAANKTRKPPPRRRIAWEIGKEERREARKEIESLPDSISNVTKRGSNWPAALPPRLNFRDDQARQQLGGGPAAPPLLRFGGDWSIIYSV